MKREIDGILEELKFKGMAAIVDQQIALAENGTAVQNIIYNLLHEELRCRQERSLINRIRNAGKRRMRLRRCHGTGHSTLSLSISNPW